MKRIQLLMIVCLLITSYYGCKQDTLFELTPEVQNSQSLKLDFEAKTGYEESNLYFLNPNFRTSIKWSKILWKSTDTAYIKVNVLDELSYPLGDTVISLQDQVWIKAFKNSKKEWRYLLLTFIPVETKHSFSGTIISSSILSNTTKIATFSKGENVRKLDQTNVAAIEKYNRNMGSLVKMAAGKKCVYAYVNGQLNQISCTDTDEIDDGDGGIYDDPPPNPGDYYPTNPPIGGGDTGEQKEENKEIIDSLQGYTCAQEVLKKLPNLENKIAQWLKKTFNNSDYDLTFRAITTMSDTLDGYYFPNNAFLYMEELRLKEQFGITYTGYNKINLAGSTKFLKKHQEYSTLLIDLANAIKEFNPAISDYDAMALAKGGVISDMNTIEGSINYNHKNGKTGTKCNP
ncbi:hypothetical protein ACR78G_10360 [Sphingobacterium spiritivorum]|uniref:hypothetical protein n=1 Tax=Sphingobacterium spiritivorum TaxID=258 RepID=UPI003DA51296